jgi:hypothetical protein
MYGVVQNSVCICNNKYCTWEVCVCETLKSCAPPRACVHKDFWIAVHFQRLLFLQVHTDILVILINVLVTDLLECGFNVLFQPLNITFQGKYIQKAK